MDTMHDGYNGNTLDLQPQDDPDYPAVLWLYSDGDPSIPFNLTVEQMRQLGSTLVVSAAREQNGSD